MHNSLSCGLCGLAHDPLVLQNLCRECKRPLLAGYDLDAIRASGRFTIDTVRTRGTRSLWRFWDVLPVDKPTDAVSQGEGVTPLLKLERRGPFAQFERLYVKDESLNPTASFKARGMSAAITRAKHLGVKTVALPSAGNAGGAAAAYAAQAGMECFVFLPTDTPPANILEAVLCGARVFLVNGLISDCAKLVQRGAADYGWFDLSTLKEPFRLEGKKTMGYELPFDLAEVGETKSPLPDWIVYPAGGGTGLIGMWKAFDEMQRLGWIGPERPRMVLVQSETCAPIVKAWRDGTEHAPLFPNASTVASGLRVPAAVGDFLMLRAVRKSQGFAVAVSDAELLDGVREVSRWQGLYVCPEGGAAWKATERLFRQGEIKPSDSVVIFNTGSGHKYNHLLSPGPLPMIDHTDPDGLRKGLDSL